MKDKNVVCFVEAKAFFHYDTCEGGLSSRYEEKPTILKGLKVCDRIFIRFNYLKKEASYIFLTNNVEIIKSYQGAPSWAKTELIELYEYLIKECVEPGYWLLTCQFLFNNVKIHRICKRNGKVFSEVTDLLFNTENTKGYKPKSGGIKK